MAGDWIKMRCELGHDPDVIQIAASLGIDEFAVVGRLHAVWSWLDQHSENGTNVRIVSAYLDRLTACPGFADAMRTVGWLDGRDGNLTFPGYETHNGDTAKRRSLETKRKRVQRDKRPAESGTNVPPDAGPEKRREEKSTLSSIEDKDPLPFQSHDFVMFWGNWEQHRKEKKQKITPTARKQQLQKLEEMGEQRAIAALKHSIANGYLGIYEPASKADSKAPSPHKGIQETIELKRLL